MDNTIFGKNDRLTIYKLEAVDTFKDITPDLNNEIMLIGFFDSEERCKQVETEYRNLPGFSLPTCFFQTTPYSFSPNDQYSISQVFYVQIVYNEFADNEETEEIGLFLSKEDAELSKSHIVINESNYNIYIDKYLINQKHWQEGFIRCTCPSEQ